jgi:predicted exporter
MGSRSVPLLLLVGVLLAALAQLIFRTQVQTDMTAFLPREHDRLQSLLQLQLEQGPAARMWLLALSGGSRDELLGASRQFARKARDSGYFSRVLNGPRMLDANLQELLFRYRYLLSDRIRVDSYSVSGLHRMFVGLLADLRSPLSTFSKALIPADPGGESLHLLEQLSRKGNVLRIEQGIWMDQEGRKALLLLHSRVSGTDLDRQRELKRQMNLWLESIRKASGLQTLNLQYAGVPALSLETRQRIRDASQRMGILAGALMLAFMFLVFRDPRRVLMTALPLFTAVAVGAASVSFVFGGIHGITLAFGATLLGVAIDYPVHLLVHQRRGESLTASMRRIRPTLFQGVLSTVLGFSAMLWSDFPGLVQLGLFSISGLLMAAWVTGFVLPVLNAGRPGSLPLFSRLPGMTGSSHTSVRLVLTATILGWFLWTLQIQPLWSRDIRSLSPVPDQVKQQDGRLRALMGAADPSAVLLVTGQDEQQVLQRQELLQPLLQQALEQGLVGDVESAASLVPSVRLQRQRQSWIPQRQELLLHLEQALAGLPFKPGVFTAFVQDLENSRKLTFLVPDSLHDTPLGLRLDALLLPASDGVIGVMPLVGVEDFPAFRALLESVEGREVWLFDIPGETARMMAGFRDDMVYKAGLASLAILLLLAAWLKDMRRCMRVLLPVALAVLVSVTVVLQSGQGLNLFHIVGLLLVAGIGLDYALFFSRRVDSVEEWQRTLYALLICSLSTLAVFAILALSGIPVLQAIAITVAAGSLAAFILSWLFAPAGAIDTTRKAMVEQ